MLGIRNAVAALLGGVSLAMMISTHLPAQSLTRVPAPDFIPLEADTAILANTRVVLAQEILTLKANENRRIFGRAVIANNGDSQPVVSVSTECMLSNGKTPASQIGGTNQNHEGKDTPVGTSYPFPGELALYPSLLFNPQKAGTYICQLAAQTDSPALSVIARDEYGDSISWLQVSSEDDKGASWWQNLPCDPVGDPNPTTTNHNSACQYLDGDSGQTQVYLFDDDATGHLWTPDPDAAFVDVSDSLLLTTCNYGTHSCTSDNTQSWWNRYIDRYTGGTKVQSHVELIQLDASGEVCNSTQSPDQISEVGVAPHHYMIYHSLSNVPIYPSCGLPAVFKLRMFVKYLSGNPIKIDGSSYGNGATTFTHAYAVTSAKGTAFPIPDLLGQSESTARNSLTSTGYAVSTVSYVTSTAPAGSVIYQYPSPGIIQFPGAAVEFTVSAGGAMVPNLLSRPESSAVATISALGLIPAVSFSKVCINPNDVLTQSPLAGTVVATGTIVHITIDSGTRQTCILK